MRQIQQINTWNIQSGKFNDVLRCTKQRGCSSYVAYILQYVVFQRRGTNHLDSIRKRPTSGLLRHILKLCHKRSVSEPDKLKHCELLSSEVCVNKLAVISRAMITLELVVKLAWLLLLLLSLATG